MNVNELFENDEETNIVNIANTIAAGEFSEYELDEVLKRIKAEDYYTDKSFQGKDKSEWNHHYLLELQMHCIEWFCEDYLRELFNVAEYVHSEKKDTEKKKTFKTATIIAVVIVAVVAVFIRECVFSK